MNRFSAEKLSPGAIFPDDPLIKATKDNDIAEIRRLIETGEVDVNCVTWRYHMGLHIHAESLEALNIFIDAGLVIDERALLIFLSHCDHNDLGCELLQRLIDCGAPINGFIKVPADAYRKRWPVIAVLQLGHYRFLEILLSNGANPTKLYVPEGLTPLHFAVQHWLGYEPAELNGDFFNAQFLRQCELLIEYGADVNARCRAGMTPILSAASDLCAPAISLLMEHGASLFDENAKGQGIITLAKMAVERTSSTSGKDPRRRHNQEYKLREVQDVYDSCLLSCYRVDGETGEYVRV